MTDWRLALDRTADSPSTFAVELRTIYYHYSEKLNLGAMCKNVFLIFFFIFFNSLFDTLVSPHFYIVILYTTSIYKKTAVA